MKQLHTILISLAAIAACTTATMADELSDLVAAVAASMEIQQRMEADMKGTYLSPTARYTPQKKETELDAAMLDGIFRSMKRQRMREMLRDADPYGDYSYQDPLIYHANPPTLGREFFRPVPGFITSRFGWRPQFQRLHHGIDISLHIGDTVRAAISGTVEKTAYDHDGYGHYVVMDHHEGMQTVYGHLQYPLVAPGQYVYAGQPVGVGGNTGNSTGPHLHFEARINGTAVDPLLIFDFYGTGKFLSASTEDINKSTLTNHAPSYSHQSKSLKKESTYIVRFGDTAESVARQAGISVMRLCQLNMLHATEPLPVGRMLKLK